MPPVRSPPRDTTTPKGKFACELCGTTISRKHDFKRHYQTRHPSLTEPKPVYSCRYDCGRTSNQKSNIITHEKTHILHEYRKEVECPFFGLDGCAWATTAAQPSVTMGRHIKRKHPQREAEYEYLKKKSRSPSCDDLDDSEEMECYVDSPTVFDRAAIKPFQESESRPFLTSYDLLPHWGAMGDALSLAAVWEMCLERERQVDEELARRCGTGVGLGFGSPTEHLDSCIPLVF